MYTGKIPHRTIVLDRLFAFSITNRCERRAGGRRPWRRQVITASPNCQRLVAAVRLSPISQQIGFHGVRSARSQTIRASSRSSQRSQSNASSASVIWRGPGRGPRTAPEGRPEFVRNALAELIRRLADDEVNARWEQALARLKQEFTKPR